MIASPGRSPAMRLIAWMAEVPEANDTACGIPTNWANAVSNSPITPEASRSDTDLCSCVRTASSKPVVMVGHW